MLRLVLKLVFFICLQLLCSIELFAQEDTTIKLKEVVLSGLRITRSKETPINITSLPVSDMRLSGALNVADALAKLPGVSQLNTGVAISKPVIRGLYGNRISVLMSGLRFDNQQWQDEHGMGISNVGLDRVELIKGPAALLYGSEAMGGLINIIEEAPLPAGSKSGDVNVGAFSNTYGLNADVGFKGSNKNSNWRIRAGINSNADYSDGNNKRILNSRFNGYYLKGSLGFSKKKWQSQNTFSSSLDNFGFITIDNQDAKDIDGRLARSMDGPHHTVLLNVLSSQNKIQLHASSIRLNAGLQSNLRLEDEGGGAISLEMLLSTFLYNFQWIKPLNNSTELIVGHQFVFENNTNFGARKIIPDANMIEPGISLFLKKNFSKLFLETGLGVSARNIHTIETPGVNTPAREIHPFNKTKFSVNGAAGISCNFTPHFNSKLNFSTGFRSGNLAELSSNGLHEGTLRWEVGDPNLSIEQNLNTELSFLYEKNGFQFSVAGYLNHFLNYIYLQNTGTEYLGFKVFHYLQANANLYGLETALDIPLQKEKISYSVAFSTVTGKLAGGAHLPFIPAAKLHQQINFNVNSQNNKTSFRVNVSLDKIFDQDNTGMFETRTAGYMLLNTGCLATINGTKRNVTLTLTANNILNRNYFDHLSRFKEYNIHNIGRNISFTLNYPFTFK